MYSRFIVSCVFALILFSGASGQNNPDVVCSVKQPNNSQVCISVKLPWELKPVFFCTDKSNINFTPQCNGHGQSHHCRDDGRTDTLKIATPWDCCPIISEPNKCSNIRCAPEPFNRTCQAIKKPGACCANYMCDGDRPAKCKAKRLEPGCLTPLPAQTNCTAFRDPYGCCHIYQCPRDEKAGICPREPHVSENVVDTRSTWTRLLDGFKSTVHKVTNQVKSHLEKHGGAVGKAIAQMIPVPFQPNIPLVPLIRCTGDYTCPGSMKCCQPLAFQFQAVARFRHETRNGHIKTSFQYKANGRQKRSDPNVVEGVCVEPEDGSIYPAFTDGPQIESTTDSSYLTSTIAAIATRSTLKPRKPPVLPEKPTIPIVPSTAAPHQPPADPTNSPVEPRTTPSESPVPISVTFTQSSPPPVQPELDRTDAPENIQNLPNEPVTSIAPPVPVTAENTITSTTASQTDSVEQPATTPQPASQPPAEPATTPMPVPQPPAEPATSSAPLTTVAPPQTTTPVTLSTTTEAEEDDTIVLA